MLACLFTLLSTHAGTIQYNRDIRPILSENCYQCHGPDKGHRKAGLRLDLKEEAFKKLESGDFVIAAGNLEKSALVHRITTTDTVEIDGHVAMTSSREILRDIANQRGPKKSLIAFGYAGWAPGQLEGEIAHGFWFTTPQDENLVFDDNRDDLWDHAMKRRTQDL